jgi:ABC-type multidrug transport system ATPase subunit
LITSVNFTDGAATVPSLKSGLMSFGKRHAVNNVSFNINGEIFGLVGPQRRGQTTPRMLVTLLKPIKRNFLGGH